MRNLVASTRLLLSLLIVSLGHPVAADDARLQDALAEIDADRIAAHVKVLASDEFEGRAPATAGEQKTIAYIQGRFREAGVSTGIGDGYLQAVPLLSSRVVDVEHSRIVGGERPVALKWGGNTVIGPNAREGRTEVDGAGLVFAGFGITAPELGWDDYADVDVRGKVVLVLYGEPEGEALAGRELTWYGTRDAKYEQAARRGAAGIILIHDDAAVGFPFGVFAASARNEKKSLPPGGERTPIPDVRLIVQERVAERILDGVDGGLDRLREAASRPEFIAQPIDRRLDLSFTCETSTSISHNVIGLVRGSERPDEVVIYTAHWDHVGIGEPVEGDAIYNGAVDNATGTAVLIEIARSFARMDPAPARSVLFVATTAEEQGLLGSAHYADHPVFPLARTAGVINMDALFPFGDFAAMTTVGLGSSELETYLERAAAAHGRTLQPDPQPELGAYFRSDHYPLAKKGVPAVFSVGGPAPDPPPAAKVLRRFQWYMTSGYHKPADEYDRSWDMRGIVGDARVFLQTGFTLAEDVRFPNWRLDHPFRRPRDEMREAGRRDGTRQPRR